MEQFEQILMRVISGQSEKMQIKQILIGTAKNVTDTTCIVGREDAPPLNNVKLNAIDDDLDSYITVIPAENSNVIVGIIETLKTEAVVLRCSEVQKLIVKIGDRTFTIDKSGIIFNDGENHGLVKIAELVEWMGKVYSDLQTLKSQLSTHPVAGNGAPLALAFSPTTPNPTQDTFEDKNIKH